MKPTDQTKEKPALLLVEDTPSLQMLYRMVLSKAGYPPICAGSGAEAAKKFEEHRPGVVLLDLVLPDMDGMSLIRQMLTLEPKTRIIVITANGSIDKAIEATRKGAHDFLVKPLGDQRLVGAVMNAATEFRARMRASAAQEPSGFEISPYFRLGQSAPMKLLCSQIAAVARSSAPVFILGERGSGKKTVARMIHKESVRAEKPFVSVNCALSDPTTLAAELFGESQMSDAASGARKGAFLSANGGTLLIENPQDMPADVQERFHKALQSGLYTSVDGTSAIPLDLRFICSARQHPAEEMRAGRLSEDLYYRLFVIPLHVPSLRERSEDIVPFATHLVSAIAQDEKKRFTSISEKAAAILAERPWPGNLRELINVLRQAVVMNKGPELTAEMLPEDIGLHVGMAAEQPGHATSLEDMIAGMTMAEIERRAVTAAIARHEGSIPRAARELDIAPSTIYRKRDLWT
ncbi:MAG: sigma-54-dependent transcriptional regulator [Roseinatronobacter sp.]